LFELAADVVNKVGKLRVVCIYYNFFGKFPFFSIMQKSYKKSLTKICVKKNHLKGKRLFGTLWENQGLNHMIHAMIF